MKKLLSISFFFLFLLSYSSLKAQGESTFVMKALGEEAFEVMRNFFNYDQGVPLDARIVETLDDPSFVRQKIVFNGVRDSRVPGYLTIPKSGNSPFPCILLLHGITSSKEAWWQETNGRKSVTAQLVGAGYAVLSLDAQYHGERLMDNDYESPGVFTFEKNWVFRFRDLFVQTVVEYRRALDYLATRDEINALKTGMIGYSMGGMMTFCLTSIDSRIKASVACVTPPLKTNHFAVEPHNYASVIKEPPFLMLMGKEDHYYTENEAKDLYELVGSKTKDLIFYDSGHGLPPEWSTEAVKWMDKYLK